MKPLASSPVFTDLIGRVAHIPVLGVAVGTFMTLVVQSSSATIAVLQNFASQPGPDGVTSILGLAGAIPILLGDNIGTTITALLASIGQSKDAKRTAVAHCIFNISGCVLFIWFVKPFAALIQNISPKGPEIEVISRQIANAHTVFNITMTLIWVCLIKLMVKIVMTLIPDGKKGVEDPGSPIYLDENIISQPAAALQLVAKEIFRMSDQVRDILKKTIELVKNEEVKSIDGLKENGEQVERLGKCITEYLAALFSSGSLTEQQAAQTASLPIRPAGSRCTDRSTKPRNRTLPQLPPPIRAARTGKRPARPIRSDGFATRRCQAFPLHMKIGRLPRQISSNRVNGGTRCRYGKAPRPFSLLFPRCRSIQRLDVAGLYDGKAIRPQHRQARKSPQIAKSAHQMAIEPSPCIGKMALAVPSEGKG